MLGVLVNTLNPETYGRFPTQLGLV